MNTKGQIGTTIVVIIVLFIAIFLVVLLAPITNGMFAEASANAELVGFEKAILENFNIIIIMVMTLVMFLLFSFRGGE